MDIKTVSVNLKNLMNKWFYTREQIHQLLEDYVTVDNNGILNVGLPSAEKITLTTQNNAITTADVAEVTAKVTDSNNNATFGVPVQFVNRATREVLYNGTTDENGECDFQYFTEEAEILPIQARISNDYIFRDDGRLNSYTSWDGNTNVTLEHNSTNTRMYATDTSGATATLSSLVLAGYNDIDFKVKLVDGTATTDFCGIRECTSSGESVANGYTTDFNLDQLNLTVGEWYHFHISVLDDRFVLYCKETGENLRIWNDDGAPAYYKFVLYCDDDVSTIDFSDVRINKTSDDLSMFIKDTENLLTFNQWTGGDYSHNLTGIVYSNFSSLEVSKEYSSNDDCSFKFYNPTSYDAFFNIEYEVPPNNVGKTIKCCFDYNLKNNYFRFNLIQTNNAAEVDRVWTNGVSTTNAQINLTTTLLEETTRITIRLCLYEGTDNILFLDNFNLNINKR